MNMYTRRFVRNNDLAHLYEAVIDPRSSPLVLIGPVGVGKTVLLKNLYKICLEDNKVIPVYCSCLSEETVICSLARIEQSLTAQTASKVQTGQFTTFLLNRIYRSLRLAMWGRSKDTVLPTGEKEIYTISLLERSIDPDAELTFQISLNEGESDFSKTLRDAAHYVSKPLLLIVDCDYRLNPDLFQVLVSAARTIKSLKVVAATDVRMVEPDKKGVEYFPVGDFSHDQVEELTSHDSPVESSILTKELWERFEGAPFLTDTFLHFLHQNPETALESTSANMSDPYAYLIGMLYSQSERDLKSVIETLAILPQGGSISDLVALTEIATDKLIEVIDNDPLVTVTPPFLEPHNSWLDLYSTLFKEQIISLLPAGLKSNLCRKIGRLYLQSVQLQELLIPPGIAISLPQFFKNSDVHLFVYSVMRTLPLAILVGDIQTMRQYLSEALDACRRHNLDLEPTLLNGMSLICLEEKNLHGAIHFGLQALDQVRKARHMQGFMESTILSNLAFLLQLQGKLTESLHYALNALAISQRLYVEYGYQGGLSASLSNVGLLYEKMESFEESLKYYESALEVDRRTFNTSGVAIDLRRIGVTLQEIGQIDKAIEMHYEALETDKMLKDLRGMAFDYGNLGVAYHLKHDYKQSLSWLKEALKLLRQVEASNEAAQVEELIFSISLESSTQSKSDF